MTVDAFTAASMVEAGAGPFTNHVAVRAFHQIMVDRRFLIVAVGAIGHLLVIEIRGVPIMGVVAIGALP